MLLAYAPRTIHKGEAWQLAPFWARRLQNIPELQFEEHERRPSSSLQHARGILALLRAPKPRDLLRIWLLSLYEDE